MKTEEIGTNNISYLLFAILILFCFGSPCQAKEYPGGYSPLSLPSVVKSLDSLGSGVDCVSILNRGSALSGVYTIAPEGNAKDVYCDMDSFGGGWTLLYSFGKNPISRFAYGSSGIRGRRSLTRAGFDFNLSHINYSKYKIGRGEMSFFKSGEEKGYIETRLPAFGSIVRVNAHTENFRGWLRVYLDENKIVTYMPKEKKKEAYASYVGGQKIRIEEEGVGWIEAIWVR